MSKILIMGAGSAQSNGVIKCLLDVKEPEKVIGAGSEPTDLVLSSAEKKFMIPHCTALDYKEKLLKLLNEEKPDFMHFQHDKELFTVSPWRDEILATGVKLMMPDHEDIDTCVFKYKSYLKWAKAGLKVPKTIVINNKNDLKLALKELGDEAGSIWLRSMAIGGGGTGAVPTNKFDFAKNWLDKHEGWGDFTAAEMLTPTSVTWLSIWNNGELVVGQGRIRKGWSGRSISGVTGMTKVGQTINDSQVDEIALASIKAISKRPHGIFAVDMAYDKAGIPNPTEINIGRFFTTVQFFKEAGLNMPEILKNIVLYDRLPVLDKKINPLKEGFLWLRGMDVLPCLMTAEDIKKEITYV